jgi:D-alanyl-lipoteichoic acid acyltransferase DltB (MBOAT superfamily)
MVFNSLEFFIFLPTVFILYWFVFNKRLLSQNILLLVASYVFYGLWDWRFLSLILLSTVVDYFVALKIYALEDQAKRKLWLWVSVLFNVGLLGFFKYYNFFVSNFVEAFSFFGAKINPNTLDIILPVGISFYTFQTLSYTIDVYKKKLEPTEDFIAFSAFVSFFPQLVAGPIERATHLLPQFFKQRTFDYNKAVDGLRQILWGLFKKVVIADNCAEFANQIFNNSAEMNGSTLVLGAIFFSFQIYGDFSGYSDIAIGTARLFGFSLMRNFAFPYFSRDIAEFWRRWHISLSAWFRDYLYIPLGGSKGGTWMKIRNTFIIFIVSGFWHGANWTFIAWGALNAIYFLPLLLSKQNRNHLEIVAVGRTYPTPREILMMLFTFSLTVIAWIFFRADSIQHALHLLKEIFSPSLLNIPDFDGRKDALVVLTLISFFLVIEWLGRESAFALEKLGLNWNNLIRYIFYFALIISIIWGGGKQQDFIYFQF